MNENVCISVILPFYNNRDTIERAVSSVLAQSYSNWELIAVDDGSDDEGWKFIERVRDSRIKCYRLPHRNGNVARNYGITHSHGSYIAMLDADDEWFENHLSCSLNVLQEEEADGVYGSVILRGKNDRAIMTRALLQDESWADFLLSNGCAAQTSTLFLTSASAKAILWDEGLLRHQDYDFVVRYSRKYRLCPKVEATTVYYQSQVPKSVGFDSCIRFIKSVEDEISIPVYMDYHLQMLHQAIACSADETIVQYYREKITRFELQQIANHLIVNSCFLTDLGLYHGKMGITLFFVHYSRYTGNANYEEFAGDLLDEIFEDIHAGITLDFENGLSGIGWGLLYLLRNHFMEGEPNEVLFDIDRKMMEINLSRVVDRSVERGLGGYLYYLSERLSVVSEDSTFDRDYRMELQKVLSTVQLGGPFDLSSLINRNKASSIADITKESLGICEGYAGLGFKLMQV